MSSANLKGVSRGPCPTCGKQRYDTRADAKHVIRTVHHGAKWLTAYRCGDYWHAGHTTYQVRRGVIPRSAMGRGS